MIYSELIKEIELKWKWINIKMDSWFCWIIMDNNRSGIASLGPSSGKRYGAITYSKLLSLGNEVKIDNESMKLY